MLGYFCEFIGLPVEALSDSFGYILVSVGAGVLTVYLFFCFLNLILSIFGR